MALTITSLMLLGALAYLPTYSVAAEGLLNVSSSARVPLVNGKNNKAYFFIPVYEVSCSIAHSVCRKFGMDQISIENENENNFLADMIRQYMVVTKTTVFWTSAEQLEEGDDFTWGNDDPMDYTNWQGDEPDLTKDGVQVFYQQDKLVWKTADRKQKGKIICETKIRKKNN